MRAEKAIEAKVLRLLPGAPKARGFLANSERPHRATFQVTAQPAERAGSAGEMRELHLSLEFKLPEVPEEASAVAEAAGVAGLSGEREVVEAAVAATRQWSWTGAESVCPYWV